MSYQQQQMGCSDPRSASGFSPVYTSFQQRWGEREKSSQMGYASAQGHMPYPADSLGQPLSGCSPQYGYMSDTTDRQHPSRCWSQAPSQQGVYMPEYHQAVQTKSPAPLLPAVKMESDLKQPFQFQAMVEGNCSRVPSCSTDNPAFDFRFHTKDSYRQGQTESEKRSVQYLRQVALQQAEQEHLPKSLYFSQSSTWAEFKRKYMNYAIDKHWSSQECKKNMGYVLDGKSAEYLHFVNKEEPNLQFYDLLIRMEDLLNEHNSQGVMSPVKMHHRQNLTQTQMQYSTPVPVYPGNNCPFPASNIVQGPPLNSHCSQTKRYTAYESPQYIYGTNSNIENQSIHTDIMSCSYHSRTLNEELESDMCTACKSNPRQQRYVPYRGPNKIKSFEKLLASNEDSAMKQEDQTTHSLSNRMARLEEMFSRITDLTDSHLSKKCKSEKQAPTLHNPFKSALHDPKLPSLHDPLKSALHDPQVTPLHNQVISAMPDQHSSLLHYPPPTKIEKPKSPENGKMKLEQSSEKRGYQCSIEKLCIQSWEQYAGWLDGLCNQQCGTSTPKEEQKRVLFECEDWSDQDFEGNDSGENSLLQLLFSEEGQIGSDAPISAVPAELQVVQVTTSGKSVSDHEIQELSSVCTEIQESNSEVAEFWWDSLDAKQLPTVDEKESLASCEEFIDLMHDRLFGTTSLNRETLHGTTEEYEAWVDKKFADTFYSASQQESCYRDKSVREVDWTPAIQSPTQQEQNYSICSAERRAALLHGVTPISAWNPSLDSEGNQFLNSKGNQFLDSEEENCSDCSFGTVTICQQRASSSAMRIPVTVQGMALKAVVDTAAMVTIVSDKVYREWTVKAPHFKAVSLKTAERDLKMDGHIVGPVLLEVGRSTFSVMVHVAPIYEDMLLGLNFLLEHAVDISLRELYLLIGQDHEKVPLEIVKTDRAGHTVSKVTVEKVEQIQAYPTIYGESNHSLDRANCSSHQPERQRRMNIISIWHQPGFSMPCQPIGSNETGSSSDPSMWFSFHQIELSDPSQSKIQRALLDTIPGLSQTFNAHILEAKVKSTSESYYSLPCWLGIVTKAARQNYVDTHHYDQSKCLVALKVHVRWLREDQQHWPWDPGVV